MALSVSDLNDLEDFFKSVDLPDKILIASGVTQHNVSAAVKSKIALLREGDMAPRLQASCMLHLRAIKDAIMNQGM